MATYTIELRKIIYLYGEQEVKKWFSSYKLEDYLLPEQLSIVQNTPIWSKDKLATKILNHFFMREIGFETPELFKHYALITMEEIMQSKLPLIYTTALEYDPLINVDYTETYSGTSHSEGNNQGQSNSSSNNNSSGLNFNSDTPQGQISKDAILQGNYASSSNASESQSNIVDDTKTSSSGVSNGNNEYTRKFKGNQGISSTYQALVKQFRDNIRAVDYEIITELQSLFMRSLLN